jgi:hypothetical protein
MEAWSMGSRSRLAVLGLASMLSFSGCLERKERIHVGADGRISVSHAFKGDAGEFAETSADKLPTGAPWRLHDEDVARAGGDGSDHVRTAAAEFASAAEIPETFGAADDPAPLHAKTKVSIERTRDGKTRWVFERRYAARTRAWRQRLFERHFPEALRKELERKEGDPPLADEVLARAADAVVRFERDRNALLLESALASFGPSADAYVLVTARDAFVKSFEEAWKPEMVLSAIHGTADERAALDARYRDETLKAAARTGAKALAERLPDAGADLPARVEKAFATARRIHDATEQLQLHGFEVRVELPAKVVASNAEALDDDGRTAVFKLSGADLCDGEHVLRAVAEGP